MPAMWPIWDHVTVLSPAFWPPSFAATARDVRDLRVSVPYPYGRSRDPGSGPRAGPRLIAPGAARRAAVGEGERSETKSVKSGSNRKEGAAPGPKPHRGPSRCERCRCETMRVNRGLMNNTKW